MHRSKTHTGAKYRYAAVSILASIFIVSARGTMVIGFRDVSGIVIGVDSKLVSIEGEARPVPGCKMHQHKQTVCAFSGLTRAPGFDLSAICSDIIGRDDLTLAEKVDLFNTTVPQKARGFMALSLKPQTSKYISNGLPTACRSVT